MNASTRGIGADSASSANPLLQTLQLQLRLLTDSDADAAFMLALLNSPGFLQNIGDRGVRDHAQARSYLRERVLAGYRQHGYGMYLVERRADGVPLGLCGLVRRDGLDAADIGFAFLPEHCGQGFGAESAAAVLAHARNDLRLPRLLAIVLEQNTASVRLLQRLGLHYERDIQLPGSTETLQLYAIAWQTPCPQDRRCAHG